MAVYDRQAFELARKRAESAPELLNAADIEQLRLIDPELAERGMLARSKALRPPAPMPVPRQAPRLDIDELAGGIVDVIAKAITPLAARVAALEQERTKGTKGVDGVRWAGVYRNGDSYQGGELVTHAGALWAAKCATTQTPGRPPEGEMSDYVLVVKNGGMR